MSRRLAFALFILASSALAQNRADASLIALYKFDDGSGTVATDSSGNGNDLDWSGSGNSWLGTGAHGGSIQLGTSGSVYARTGGAQAGTISNLNAVTGNDVSISFWAKPNNESQGSSIFYINDSAGGTGNRIAQSHVEWTDGNIYWDSDWGDGTNRRATKTGGQIVANELHHFVMTYSGDSNIMQIYMDGALGATTTWVGAADPFNWAGIRNFEIGAFSFASFWGGGQIDDFAIYNQFLNAGDVALIKASGAQEVPEPASLTLLALGAAALLRRRRGAAA